MVGKRYDKKKIYYFTLFIMSVIYYKSAFTFMLSK